MPDPDEGCAEINDGEGDIPLLKWVEEDSESEQFTLVQSRKKKKKTYSEATRKSSKLEPCEESKNCSFCL
jgi:hypothetical protein